MNSEKGFMLISVIVLMALTMLVAAGMVSTKATEARIRSTSNEQVTNYNEVEETMSKTVAWLQTNSNNIVGAFLASNFNTNFDTSSPSVGANESTYFSVPTMVKMKGTSNSVMLSNNALFGTSAFPTTTNINTNASFNAVSAFAAADLGSANTRVILVWARNTDGNFQPIFRVDTITGNAPDRGVHNFTYIYSTLVSSNTSSSFFSTVSPFVLNTGNNQCYSHAWTYSGGAWSSGSNRSNCTLASNTDATVNANVGGNVLAKGAISGGGVISGTTCQNSNSCHSLVAEAVPSWDSVCSASNQGDLTISSNTTLSVAGNLPSQKCWRDVHINSNRTLTLDTTSFPYHFRTLTLQDNSNSRIAFAHIGSNAATKYTIYAQNFAGGSFNGNQWLNTNNSPSQVKLYITGSSSTLLNGTAVIRAHIVAPSANITLNGNFNFYGGIESPSIYLIGNARIYADEALVGSPVVSGLSFAQTKASQRYRMF